MKKVGLKLNIQKTKIVASGPIISWQTEGGKVAVTNFIFLSSKITADDNCSYEIKMLAPWNGEGNGIPLQYSCLENPMDGGVW